MVWCQIIVTHLYLVYFFADFAAPFLSSEGVEVEGYGGHGTVIKYFFVVIPAFFYLLTIYPRSICISFEQERKFTWLSA
jgi:hypothetical protein